MSLIDLILMGFKNLFRRKLRTFLTALGIVIGTVSIVVMISMGIAMQTTMTNQINEMGDITLLTVVGTNNSSSNKGRIQTSRNNDNKLKDEHVQELKKLANVEAVTPFLRLDGFTITSKRYKLGYARIQGIDMTVGDKFGLEVEKGRLVNPQDKNALVFGSEVIYQFYKENSMRSNMYRWDNPEQREAKVDVIKDRLNLEYEDNGQEGPKVQPRKVKGVGILKEGNWETANNIYMDIESVRKIKEDLKRKNPKLKKEEESFDKILVKVNEYENVQAVQESIKEAGYDVYGMLDYVKSMQDITKTIQMIIAGIGSISLLVAAIGITNTMVMAIYERRREIGIMKVIGAQIKDIKRLFLLEAAGIGVLGGVIGIVLSYLISYFLNKLVAPLLGGMFSSDGKALMSIIPIWLAAGAVTFTALIGIISGYLPAKKAMKLSALEAIKND
ncbi:ABC transporter permease [Oceanirhabdus seepicola]|uniref:ABC transporter permease n=1 Tax=Oceanirhabdus seepicola TaxID=2828781 RepID=A0A9J6NV18_9CLOT|nr:ABC transporter permease [Oceanirhabdus seepicola]MCM1988322.1 ABC transporter permease [Oceanirhabdus seepicola]